MNNQINVVVLALSTCSIPATSSSSLYNSKVAYPGIWFFEKSIRERNITHRGATIQSPTTGICLTIPEQSLSSGDIFDLLIHPCISGPFELPTDYVSASPTYLIQSSREVTFLKHVTIEIHHHASLLSEADCEEMGFFSAHPTPQYRSDHPVYTFKHITGCKETFRTKCQVGEIQLKHFCLIKIGRKRKHHNEEMMGDATLYSARLYRSLTQDTSRASAVFCMCLYQPLYITCCDQRIAEGYTAMSSKEEARSVVIAQIAGDEILLSATTPKEWSVTFDREPTKMKKRDVDIPEFFNIAVNELPDYPPKFLIYIENRTLDEVITEAPKLLVEGLDINDCSFKLLTPSTSIKSTRSSAGASKQQHNTSPITLKKLEQSNKREETPSLHEVLIQLQALNREWNPLAMALGLEHREIQVIEVNHSGDVKKCLERVIEEWLKWKGKEVSWKTLYKALRDPLVGRPDIASEIKDKYLETS